MATIPAEARRHTSNGRAQPPALIKGDDAVPRGLAVASAITLRLLIVAGGIFLVAMAASRMMMVVLPVIIALLLTTLLAPGARRLERRGWRPAPASALLVFAALLVFVGLWALIIPGVLSQSDDLFTNVQDGAGQAVGVLEPLGVGRADVDRAIDDALSSVQGKAVANEVLTGAVLLTQWAAAVILIVVLTFFFVKDGGRLWEWVLELFHEDRQPMLREVGDRSWGALSAYVQGVFLVATIDAVLIGAALVIVGVPVAMPLIVLTFVGAFFPVVGAFVAGAAAVLVALVANGRRRGAGDPGRHRGRAAARGQRVLSRRRRPQAAAAPGRHPARADGRRRARRRGRRLPRGPDRRRHRRGAAVHARAPRGAPELSGSGSAVAAASPSRSRRAGA